VKKLIIGILVLTSASVFATDACLNKGGKIINGSLEKGLVRVCAFEESGIGSAIGYNDIFLKSQGNATTAVKVFLAKKTADSLALGAKEICKKQSANNVLINFGGNESVNFCLFKDGSLIETITLSLGSAGAKELTAALK
jgi:hypothetical protein